LNLLCSLLFLAGCSHDQYDFKNLKSYEFQLEDEFPVERPFIACYKKDHQKLCYIGSDHSSEINSKTFKLIQKTIEEFKPDLLVLEGFETNKGLSPTVMINYVRKSCATSSSNNFKCGEPLYAVHLGHLKNIPFIGGEPDDEQIFTALQGQGHEKDDVFGFYFTRQIAQYFDEKQVSAVSELQKKFDEFLKNTRVDGIHLTYASYQDWLNQKMGRPVELSELRDPNLIAPIGNGNKLQQISSKINLIRDQHILKVILDSSQKYQRILVIYGASHYLTQRGLLAQYFGNPIYSHE